MEEITLVYAQKLVEELMESSSSSDEDDEVLAVLRTINPQKVNSINNKEVETIWGKNQETEKEITNNEVIASLNEEISDHAKNSFEVIKFDKNSQLINTNLFSEQAGTSYEVIEFDLPEDANSQLSVAPNEKHNETILNNCVLLQHANKIIKHKAIESFSETEFKEHFKVSRDVAIYIMEKYSLMMFKSSYLECNNKSAVEQNILSFLWFVGNESSASDVAEQFSTTSSEICKTFNNVIKFLLEEMAPEVIRFPNTDVEKNAIAKDFENVAGFPNVLGCVAESYFSFKKHKIFLRGICDANLRFLSVKTRLSRDIADTLIEKDLPKLCFPNYYLLGDEKCPIGEYLMPPYNNNGNLDESEKYFNIKLYRTHVKIKNAFGILRSRFGQLKSLESFSFQTISNFIFACCVLHNICIDRHDFHNEQIYTDVSNRWHNTSLAAKKSKVILTNLGLMKRYELKTSLFNSKV